MRLYLIRHATAVERGTPGLPDDERPLTPRGRRRFEAAARGLARVFPQPDGLLTSPLPRARQTAEIASRAWRGPAPRETPALADGDHEALAREIERLKRAERVALVGHEPHLSQLLAALLGGAPAAPLGFKKGGLAVVDLEGPVLEGGQLVAFVPPRVLRALGR